MGGVAVIPLQGDVEELVVRRGHRDRYFDLGAPVGADLEGPDGDHAPVLVEQPELVEAVRTARVEPGDVDLGAPPVVGEKEVAVGAGRAVVDIRASNGIIHAVNRVLIPPSLQ